MPILAEGRNLGMVVHIRVTAEAPAPPWSLVRLGSKKARPPTLWGAGLYHFQL